MMDLETFQSLPTDEVARLVREAGSKVCVFPTKGSRRWLALEHPHEASADFARAYFQFGRRRHLELFGMVFDHGIGTLLTPFFGPNEMERGEAFMQMVGDGLALLASHPEVLDFYKTYQVRVRFYGNYRRSLDSTPYAHLLDLFDEVTAQTMAHDQYRLFYGLFAHDPYQKIAELVVRYHTEHGCVPAKDTLVEMYYGEHIRPVDLFIGFGKPRVFDVPLLLTGREDLYFTVSPSLYLNERQLRNILYDHLYSRIRTQTDLRPYDWAVMRDFYRANVDKTLGVGVRQGDMVWYPLPQVMLPPKMRNLEREEQPG
jgi:hypothetical protein